MAKPFSWDEFEDAPGTSPVVAAPSGDQWDQFEDAPPPLPAPPPVERQPLPPSPVIERPRQPSMSALESGREDLLPGILPKSKAQEEKEFQDEIARKLAASALERKKLEEPPSPVRLRRALADAMPQGVAEKYVSAITSGVEGSKDVAREVFIDPATGRFSPKSVIKFAGSTAASLVGSVLAAPMAVAGLNMAARHQVEGKTQDLTQMRDSELLATAISGAIERASERFGQGLGAYNGDKIVKDAARAYFEAVANGDSDGEKRAAERWRQAGRMVEHQRYAETPYERFRLDPYRKLAPKEDIHSLDHPANQVLVEEARHGNRDAIAKLVAQTSSTNFDFRLRDEAARRGMVSQKLAGDFAKSIGMPDVVADQFAAAAGGGQAAKTDPFSPIQLAVEVAFVQNLAKAAKEVAAKGMQERLGRAALETAKQLPKEAIPQAIYDRLTEDFTDKERWKNALEEAAGALVAGGPAMALAVQSPRPSPTGQVFPVEQPAPAVDLRQPGQPLVAGTVSAQPGVITGQVAPEAAPGAAVAPEPAIQAVTPQEPAEIQQARGFVQTVLGRVPGSTINPDTGEISTPSGVKITLKPDERAQFDEALRLVEDFETGLYQPAEQQAPTPAEQAVAESNLTSLKAVLNGGEPTEEARKRLTDKKLPLLETVETDEGTKYVITDAGLQALRESGVEIPSTTLPQEAYMERLRLQKAAREAQEASAKPAKPAKPAPQAAPKPTAQEVQPRVKELQDLLGKEMGDRGILLNELDEALGKKLDENNEMDLRLALNFVRRLPSAQPAAVPQGAPAPAPVAPAPTGQAPGRPVKAGEAVAKEPWQMTRKEFSDASTLKPSGKDAHLITPDGQKWLSPGSRSKARAVEITHKAMISDAIREGKPVPAEVLAEYPDLAKPAPTPAPAPSPAPAPAVTTPPAKPAKPIAPRQKLQQIDNDLTKAGIKSTAVRAFHDLLTQVAKMKPGWFAELKVTVRTSAETAATTGDSDMARAPAFFNPNTNEIVINFDILSKQKDQDLIVLEEGFHFVHLGLSVDEQKELLNVWRAVAETDEGKAFQQNYLARWRKNPPKMTELGWASEWFAQAGITAIREKQAIDARIRDNKKLFAALRRIVRRLYALLLKDAKLRYGDVKVDAKIRQILDTFLGKQEAPATRPEAAIATREGRITEAAQIISENANREIQKKSYYKEKTPEERKQYIRTPESYLKWAEQLIAAIDNKDASALRTTLNTSNQGSWQVFEKETGLKGDGTLRTMLANIRQFVGPEKYDESLARSERIAAEERAQKDMQWEESKARSSGSTRYKNGTTVKEAYDKLIAEGFTELTKYGKGPVQRYGLMNPADKGKNEYSVKPVRPFERPYVEWALKQTRPEAPVAKPAPAPTPSISVLDALNQGLTVRLPKGANAVQVTTDKGKAARVRMEDLGTLKGAGPFSKVIPLAVKSDRTGRTRWDQAQKGEGEITVKKAVPVAESFGKLPTAEARTTLSENVAEPTPKEPAPIRAKSVAQLIADGEPVPSKKGYGKSKLLQDAGYRLNHETETWEKMAAAPGPSFAAPSPAPLGKTGDTFQMGGEKVLFSAPGEAEKRKPLSVDEHGKQFVWKSGGISITVDDVNDAKYVALWNEGKRIGTLSTRRHPDSTQKDWLGISSVEITPKFRGKGFGTEMYRQLLANMGNQYRGISTYLPDQANRREIPAIYKRLGGWVEGDYGFIPRKERTTEKQEGEHVLFSSPSPVTPEQDAAYLSLARKYDAGDKSVEPELQSMVDEAAKKAGYDVPVYHAGRVEDHFDQKYAGTGLVGVKSGHVFFGSDKDAVDYYAEPESGRNTRKYFLKADNLREFDGGSPRQNADTAYVEAFQNDQPNDGTVTRNVVDGDRMMDVYTVPYNDDGTTTQAKLADPITRDEQGRIIPLSERFNPEKESILFAPPGKGTDHADTWFSQLVRAIADKMPNAASAEQVRGIIENPQNSVKPDEIKWTGLDDWLKEKAGQKITKSEVQAFLDQNKVQVREVVKGGAEQFDEQLLRQAMIGKNWNEKDAIKSSREYGKMLSNPATREMAENELQESGFSKEDYKAPEGTKFSQWQTPGGQNYRELLLTMPVKEISEPISIEEWYETSGVRFDFKRTGKPIPTFEELRPLEKEDIEARYKIAKPKKVRDTSLDFRSSHFDEPNILAHVRFNERMDAEGMRMLFIEEIQSDWAQGGRKRGFGSGAEERFEKLKAEIEKKHGKSLVDLRTSRQSDDVIRDLVAIDGAYRRAQQEKHGTAVPPGPFVGKTEAWAALAMKRMVRWAAENGFDKIAWTTGEMQAERYDLSKQVDSIGYANNPDGTTDIHVYKDGKEVIVEKNLADSRLSETIGKDVAEKIKKSGQVTGTLEGLDLKVGGQGMRGFYDVILPSVANKLGKKWGAKVGETEIDTGELGGVKMPTGYKGKTLTAHSLPITPSMKESVMQKGQVLFAPPEIPPRPKARPGETPGRKISTALHAIRNSPGFAKAWPEAAAHIAKGIEYIPESKAGREDFAKRYLAQFGEDLERAFIATKNADNFTGLTGSIRIHVLGQLIDRLNALRGTQGAGFAKRDLEDAIWDYAQQGLSRDAQDLQAGADFAAKFAPEFHVLRARKQFERKQAKLQKAVGDALVGVLGGLQQAGAEAVETMTGIIDQLKEKVAALQAQIALPDPSGFPVVEDYVQAMAKTAARMVTRKASGKVAAESLPGLMKRVQAEVVRQLEATFKKANVMPAKLTFAKRMRMELETVDVAERAYNAAIEEMRVAKPEGVPEKTARFDRSAAFRHARPAVIAALRDLGYKTPKDFKVLFEAGTDWQALHADVVDKVAEASGTPSSEVIRNAVSEAADNFLDERYQQFRKGMAPPVRAAYERASARRVLSGIAARVKDVVPKPALEAFYNRLTAAVGRHYAASQPKKAAQAIADPLEAIQRAMAELVANRDKYESVIKEVLAEADGTMDAPALAALKAAFSAEMETMTAKQAAGALNLAAKDLGLAFRDIMQSSETDQIASRQAIIDRILAHPVLQGLADEDAQQVAEALAKAWEAKRNAIFRAEFKRLVPMPNLAPYKAQKVEASIPRILQMANLELLDNEAFFNAVAPEFGLPAWTQEIADTIYRMAQRTQAMPEGRIRNRAHGAMLDYISLKAGMSRIQMLASYWYMSVLSGTGTQAANIISAAFNINMSALLTAGANRQIAGPLLMRHLKGTSAGFADKAYDILGRGDMSATLHNEINQASRPIELMAQSANPIARFFSNWKYVGRFMSFADAAQAGGPQEYRAYLLAYNRAKAEGVPAAEVEGYIKDLLKLLPGDEETARAQALQELKDGKLEPSDVRWRIREILEQARPIELMWNAKRFAMAQGFNLQLSESGTSMAYLGQMLAALRRQFPPITPILAFIQTVVNVTDTYMDYLPPVALFRLAQQTGVIGHLHQNKIYGVEPVFKQMSPEDIQLLRAKLFFSSSMITAVILAYYMQPDDPEKRWLDIHGGWHRIIPPDKQRELRNAKHEPYSVRIGRHNFRFEQLSALAMPLAMLGNHFDSERYGEFDNKTRINQFTTDLLHGGLVVQDMAFFARFTDVLGVLANGNIRQGENMMMKLAAGTVGGLVPNILKEIDTWRDPAIYKSRDPMDYLLQSVPIARSSIGKPMINVLGEEVEVRRSPWSRFWSYAKPNELWDEIAKKQALGVFIPVVTSATKYDSNSQRVKMNDDEFYEFSLRIGRRYKTILERSIRDGKFQKMTEDETKDFYDAFEYERRAVAAEMGGIAD